MSDWLAADDPLVGLTDDALVEQAIRDRTQARLHRSRQSDVATLIGTLVDLAETAAAVSIDVSTGRTHQGRLTGVAADHVSLRLAGTVRLLVRTSTIAAVRPDPGATVRAAMGDRDHDQSTTLLEVLAGLVDTDHEVSVVVRGSSSVMHGHLLAVGEDVVTLQLQGQSAPVYIAGDAICDVLVPA